MRLIKDYSPWVFLNAPACALWAYLALCPEHFQVVIVTAAYCALALLIGILLLNPAISVFPQQTWLKKLNRYRQEIGVSCFVYALVHASGFVVKRGGLLKALPWIAHPIVFIGFIAFSILFALAITSNRFSMRKLTGPRWKKLHKSVYIAQWLVLAHMLLVGTPKNYVIALIFAPLAILQLQRRRNKNRKR